MDPHTEQERAGQADRALLGSSSRNGSTEEFKGVSPPAGDIIDGSARRIPTQRSLAVIDDYVANGSDTCHHDYALLRTETMQGEPGVQLYADQFFCHVCLNMRTVVHRSSREDLFFD
jgi:hypothetical protein